MNRLPSTQQQNKPAQSRKKTADRNSDYFRKAADAFKALKWASIIAVFILIITTFILYRHEMTLENLRYIMRYVNFDIGSDYRSSNQIDFRTEPDTEFAYLKGDLAMVSPTNFSVYEFTGQALVDDRISYLNPAVKTNGRYALIYDVTGTELALYNSNGCLFEKDFSYGIKDAALRSDGIFAVVSSDSFVSSKVTVFAADYGEDYTVSSTDKEILNVQLPDGTKRMDILMLQASEGDFLCYLRSYDMRSREQTHTGEVRITGEFPLRLVSEKDSIAVLTDKMLHFYDGGLGLLAEYPVGGGKLKSFYEAGDYIAVTYEKDITGTSRVRVFSKDGREISVEGIDREIISFASEGNDMYFLEKGKLHLMRVNNDTGSAESKSIPSVEVDELYTDVFAKSGSEYILASHTGAGKFE